MDEYESLNHTKWDCKDHVVLIPKYRRKTPFGQLRRELGSSFKLTSTMSAAHASVSLRSGARAGSREATSCPITCTCCFDSRHDPVGCAG